MKKLIWNKENLTVVYFATKYGLHSLNENITSVCHKLDLSEGSFELLSKMVNYAISGEDKLSSKRKSIIEIVQELEQKTKQSIKETVCEILYNELCLGREVNQYNKKIQDRTKLLNEELGAIHNKKIAELRKYRRLVKVS